MLGPFDTAELVCCRYCGEPSDGAAIVIVNSGAFHDCERQLLALVEAGYTHDDDGEALTDG